MHAIEEFVMKWTGRIPQSITTIQHALTPGSIDQERLECLGDSVLGHIAMKYLYHTYQSANEGILSRLRMRLVNGNSLVELATYIDLGSLSPEVAECEKTLEDAFEAFIGALYLEFDFEVLYKFAVLVFRDVFPEQRLWRDSNYRDGVNKLQMRMKQQSSFTRTNTNGVVTVTATLAGFVGKGISSVMKNAEQAACYNLLKNMGIRSFKLGQDPLLHLREFHVAQGHVLPDDSSS